ncbi:MAG: DeoR/GlpR family DNA-binding transcription regulator [Clostridia bacterium]|nr:DeoR/GlpR family DNA-binding transcription regulator [Clostridia bacterium]
MKLSERQKEIFNLICENKKMSVKELSSALYVSGMTVRRDLAELSKNGYVKRYRGGAMCLPENKSFPVSSRMHIEEDEKRALAKKAAEFLEDGLNIFIDSSSTSQFIIPHIKKFENIKIITNSVNALISASEFHIPCFIIGGDYLESDMCLVGTSAEKQAENLNVDMAFITTQGITEDGAITDSSPEITGVKEQIMKNAKHSVFLFEKSKIGIKGLYTICRKTDENVTVITL